MLSQVATSEVLALCSYMARWWRKAERSFAGVASRNASQRLGVMAKWTKDAVEELLVARMKATSSRIKLKGHKVSIEDLASELAPFVIALMSDSRRRELTRIYSQERGMLIDPPFEKLLAKRQKELKVMAEVLWRFAEAEAKRKGSREV